MPTAVLLDTGPLVAAFDRRDQYHAAVRRYLADRQYLWLTTWPVLTEAAYLLLPRPDLIDGLVQLFHRGTAFRLIPLDQGDFLAMGGLMQTYRDLPLQLADASLLHIANERYFHDVLTIDRKNFSVVRTTRGEALRLLPVNPNGR